MDDDIEALAARQHGLVTYAQLVALGLSRAAIRHRIDRGRLRVVHHHVYRLAGAQVTWRMKVLAAVLAAEPGAVASHETAAALSGVPGFSERIPEITVPHGRSRRLSGVIVHESRALPDHHVKIIDGIPTTSIARTLCDLAATIHPKRVARALDNCLTRGWVSVPALWRVHADLAEHGRDGIVLMRELLLARGEGYVAPASELERRLLELLRDAGLPEPAREIDLGTADTWTGRVELVYRDVKLLIEADSRLHHTSLLDRASDMARDNQLMAEGWRVIRVTWEMITQRPDEVVALIRRALGLLAAPVAAIATTDAAKSE